MALVNVLTKFIKAISCTIANIIGIPPGICSQNINVVKDYKPTIKNQRWLNPPMQEVIKKKIIKWLDVGVVYPILDSRWVSPVQYEPKKRV